MRRKLLKSLVNYWKTSHKMLMQGIGAAVPFYVWGGMLMLTGNFRKAWSMVTISRLFVLYWAQFQGRSFMFRDGNMYRLLLQHFLSWIRHISVALKSSFVYTLSQSACFFRSPFQISSCEMPTDYCEDFAWLIDTSCAYSLLFLSLLMWTVERAAWHGTRQFPSISNIKVHQGIAGDCQSLGGVETESQRVLQGWQLRWGHSAILCCHQSWCRLWGYPNCCHTLLQSLSCLEEKRRVWESLGWCKHGLGIASEMDQGLVPTWHSFAWVWPLCRSSHWAQGGATCWSHIWWWLARLAEACPQLAGKAEARSEFLQVLQNLF